MSHGGVGADGGACAGKHAQPARKTGEMPERASPWKQSHVWVSALQLECQTVSYRGHAPPEALAMANGRNLTTAFDARLRK